VKRSPTLLFGVAAAGVALDQWTKVWASNNLAFHEPLRVIGDLVRFTYTRNSGIAFGMFAGQSFPFYIFSIVAAVAVIWLWVRHPQLPALRQWSLALILGGAIGNLIDRLSWRGHEFPVFNVADMCVTFGVILFALVWTQDPHAPQAATEEPLLAGPPDAPEPTHLEEVHGPHAGAGSPGYGGGRPLGPVAGEGSDRGPLA
jgi:signal peptidase II